MDRMLVHSVFEERVKEFPDHTAISMGTIQLSYFRLNQEANRLANFLKDLDHPGDLIIGVLAGAGIEQVISLAAIFKAGAIYMPLSLDFSEKRFRQVFTQSPPTVLIVQEQTGIEVIALLQRIGAAVRYIIMQDDRYGFSMLERWEGHYRSVIVEGSFTNSENPGIAIKGGTGNYIFFTSGSSGEPKAILGKHESLSHFIHWEIKEFALTPACRISCLTQLTFDASLRDIWVPLCSGGTLCIPTEGVRQDLHLLIRWLRDERITLLHSVPSLFRAVIRLLQDDRTTFAGLPDCRFILLAGELLYAKDILQWRELAGNDIVLVNLYGATETTLIKVFSRIGEISQDPTSIIPAGRPIDNTSIAILNGKKICRPGEIGEIYIKTPFASKGYYGNEDLTKEVFVQNPLVADREDIVYRTGDQGRFLKDGTIEVLGRLDGQVKINGVRVELREIEQAVLENKEIDQVVVKAHKNQDNQQELICYYTGQHVSRDDLRLHLEKRLNKSHIPGYLIRLDKFPLTLNGKIDHRALSLNKSYLFNELEYQPPASRIEVTLEKIWAGILGLSRVSRDTSFFQVGGHSLRAVQLVSRIHSECRITLKITDIFNNPTIRQQAQLLKNLSEQAAAPLRPRELQKSYVVSHGQLRLWIQHQQNENGSEYNIPTAYRLKGRLNMEALEHALKGVAERHESIRTTFRYLEGELWQEIKSAGSFPVKLELIDLQLSADPEEDLKGRLYKEASLPFDLEKGPLLRYRLFRLGKEDFVFFFVMHHIVCDGWSMEILFKEVISLYNRYPEQTDISLPPLTLQYKDYALWVKEYLDLHRQDYRDYWKERFTNPPPVLQLPCDFPRPAVQTFNGETYAFSVDQELVGQLEEMSNKYEVTISTILLSALAATLYVASRQNDIVIGVPFAGRSDRQWEEQIGFFVNTLPLRLRFEEDDSLIKLLATAKKTSLDAYANQMYPFDQIIEDINTRTDRSRNALFDIGFHFYNIGFLFDPSALQMAGDIEIREIDTGHRTVKSDICLNAVLLQHGLELSFDYNTDLFRWQTIESMAKDFSLVLKTMLRKPDLQVCLLRTCLASVRRSENEMVREQVRIRNLRRLPNV